MSGTSSQQNLKSITGNATTEKGTQKKLAQKKIPELPLLERRNWLIHLHYIRKDFQTCKTLIGEQLEETSGTCEYAQYIKALILREEGDVKGSLELFQTCCTLNGSPENLKQVARSFVLLGQHKDALAVYEEANKAAGQPDWEILHNYGLCYMHLNDIHKAKEYFDQALKVRAHEQTLAAMGEALLQEGDLQAGLAAYKRAVELSPENVELNCKLGQLYIKAGLYQKGFERAGSALAHSGTEGHVGALLVLGHVMQSHGDLDAALAKYRLASGLAPHSFALWNNVAMCFYAKKKYVAAMSCLKRAHYLCPLAPTILYNLGLVHLTMQQLASAFHFLSTAVQLAPTDGQAYHLLAMTLKLLQDYDNATQAYQKAMKFDVEDPLIPLNFAVFLLGQGDTDRAAECLRYFDERCQKSNKPLAKDAITTAHKLADHLQMRDQIFQQPSQPDYSQTGPPEHFV